jgi:hypothetical protein
VLAALSKSRTKAKAIGLVFFRARLKKRITWRGSGGAVAHEADHGDVDEGFGAGLSGLVVSDEASVLREPPDGLFDEAVL